MTETAREIITILSMRSFDLKKLIAKWDVCNSESLPCLLTSDRLARIYFHDTAFFFSLLKYEVFLSPGRPQTVFQIQLFRQQSLLASSSCILSYQ